MHREKRIFEFAQVLFNNLEKMNTVIQEQSQSLTQNIIKLAKNFSLTIPEKYEFLKEEEYLHTLEQQQEEFTMPDLFP